MSLTELEQARRDAVARLCRAQVNGLLSPEGFDERYAALRAATSPAAIAALVADLGAGEVLGSGAEDQTGGLVPTDTVRLPAIFGSATRAGRWVVPEEMHLLIIAGEAHLDFRNAIFTRDAVVLQVSVTLGSLKLSVPPGTQVENECRQMLSSSSHSRPRKGPRPTPNGLLIVVQGRLLLGELVVKEFGGG